MDGHVYMGPARAAEYCTVLHGSLHVHRMKGREHGRTILSNICCYYTSSTAQGGGGSFKNRKPIGDVGCCESGMAERSH